MSGCPAYGWRSLPSQGPTPPGVVHQCPVRLIRGMTLDGDVDPGIVAAQCREDPAPARLQRSVDLCCRCLQPASAALYVLVLHDLPWEFAQGTIVLRRHADENSIGGMD